MKAIFLLILSSVMFVCVGEAQETQPTCDITNFRDYIYRDYFSDYNDWNSQIICDLSHKNLEAEDLSRAKLANANLAFTNFSNTNLSYADLRYADVSYTDFSNTNLSYADIRYVHNLSDATFNEYTNFEGTKVTPKQALLLSKQGISGFEIINTEDEQFNIDTVQLKNSFCDRQSVHVQNCFARIFNNKGCGINPTIWYRDVGLQNYVLSGEIMNICKSNYFGEVECNAIINTDTMVNERKGVVNRLSKVCGR